MRDLESGVMLFALDPGFGQDRITLSEGTSVPRQDENDKYTDEARIPNGPWHAPSETEHQLLWSSCPLPTYKTIGLARIYGVEELVEIGADILSLRDIPLHDASDSQSPLVSKLYSHISRFSMCAEVDWHGLNWDLPNLHTVSRDEVRNKLVGLHVDYWDGKPLGHRENSRNRICINVGLGDRYFLFVNLTLGQLRHKLKAAFPDFISDEPALIGQTFLRLFPNYPVTRILLRPGEAYIAPTENILHDGSSFALFDGTWNVAFQGHFGFCDQVSFPRSTL